METNKLYAGRRRKNLITMGLSLAATTFGLGWLVLILGSLLWEGLSGLSPRVFTEMTPPPQAETGGLANAIFGSLVMVTLATLLGTPIGILMRRWAQRFHALNLPHYAVSIVRGRGIDAELGGQIRLTGTARNIIPIGQLELIRGRVDLLNQPSVAIVGARIASAGGQRIARGLAQQLGQAGHVVVSGMARGIDAALRGLFPEVAGRGLVGLEQPQHAAVDLLEDRHPRVELLRRDLEAVVEAAEHESV